MGVYMMVFFFFEMSLVQLSLAHPLCTDSKAPFVQKTPLSFCGYSGSICCNSTQDALLKTQFQAINVSDSVCGSLLKSILCAKLSCQEPHDRCKPKPGPNMVGSDQPSCQSPGPGFAEFCFDALVDADTECRQKLLGTKSWSSFDLLVSASTNKLSETGLQRCDQFSAELFRIKSGPRDIPVLCNSTVSDNSTQSQQAATDYCSELWYKCQNISILNSPFSSQAGSQKQANTTAKLTDLWQSKNAFCNEFGGASIDGSVCFYGEQISFNSSKTPSPPNGMCLEKIGNGSYLNMVPHPDKSNRVFLSDQPGKIWLASVPEEESGEVLGLNEANPYLDLTDEVHADTELGMMGIAFHPNFQQNGRIFASFNCDKAKWPECSGRCACNSDVGCDPSKLGSDNGAQPCQYHAIIAEFTTNETASEPSLATSAKPTEVRRIFTMGLPYTSHHAGQILFGPEDGYLYFMMGDGGGTGDPNNFAQNKKSLLGKIMRLDIDNIPSARETSNLGSWGNYSIPGDNPYIEDTQLNPEIWALGFRNPWRCSFDYERPSYFLCADVGQDQYEEVDIVTKGGNFGWRVYEGPYLFNASQSLGGNTSASSINPIFPVMGYNHSEVNNAEGSASITGGYYYRSTTDPCMYGRYVYADLYAGGIWAGTESPDDSGNFTTVKLPISCASDSPIKCDLEAQSSRPALGYIFSFGEDNRKDVFILASSGVYRIARPSRCSYACSKENTTNNTRTGSAPPPPPLSSSWSMLRRPCEELMVAMLFSSQELAFR
ncbi:Glucose/Sorbosone dehydrogenase, partial [Dillenia turbinata]